MFGLLLGGQSKSADGDRKWSAMPGRSAQPQAGQAYHAVQFYGDDAELSASVADFLGQGLAGGGSAIVVATPAHSALFAADTDAGAAQAAGGLTIVDAAGMLSGFLTGDRLDPSRFRAAAGDLIGPAARAGAPVRIYAEIVTLLWDAGQVAMALELEALWNDLAAQLPFSLLCAYPAHLVTGHDNDAGALEELCRLHTGVLGSDPGAPAAGDSFRTGGAAARGFPAVRDSARHARHFVLGQLGSLASQAVGVNAAIVTAELAANVVLHARSAFTVTISDRAGTVRISVRDATPLDDGGPLAVIPGHGLDVVAKLAARWAIEPLPDGKVVWAEVPYDPEAEGEAAW